MKKVKFRLAEIHDFTSEEAQQLLHNKFVVVIGDSNYRAIYKDLVYFLQHDEMIPIKELREKHEPNFTKDCLVELNVSSGNDYRLVRQYRTRHHLVRFYFITRAYSSYVDSIMNDFRAALKADLVPDVVIVHSCLWDLNRYHDKVPTEPPLPKAIREYRQNTKKLFQALNEVLPSHTLVIWNTAMSITKDARGYVIEQPCKMSAVDMIEANFYSANLARAFRFDVLDLHFYFRFLHDLHAPDGTHWNLRAHRYLTKLLLTHLAEAWQVQLQKERPLMDIQKFRKTSPWRNLNPAPPQLIPTLWTNGSARDFYSRRPSHLSRNAHKKRLRARLSQCHHSLVQLGGPYDGLQGVPFYPGPYDPPFQDGRLSSFADQGPRLHPSSLPHFPQGVGDASTPLNIVEQEQCLQPHNDFQEAHGTDHDSSVMGLPEEGPWPPWPPFHPRRDFPVHHNVRSGPWSTDGDEGDPGFPFHMEGQVTFADRYEDPEHPNFYDDGLLVPNNVGPPMPCSGFTNFEESGGFSFRPDNLFRENHPNYFSGPESFTQAEGWAPYSLPRRIPCGAWIGSRKMLPNRPRHANHRRQACAPYAASRKTSRDSY